MTESLRAVVRLEVQRALGMLGLASADQLADVTARVRDLEEEVRTVRDELARARKQPKQREQREEKA